MLCVIDANVYLSFLLKPRDAATPPTHVVELIVAGAFDILFPHETEIEIRSKVATKPYLQKFVDSNAAEQLIGMLNSLAAPVPIRRLAGVEVRDPADIYLLDEAFSGGADFLMTGDKHLRAVRHKVSWASIVTPAEFLSLLQTK